MYKQFFLIVILSFLISVSFGQRGKDGDANISTTNTVLNIYTSLIQDGNQGNNTISVVNTTGFSIGDLVLIIQMQGATLRGNVNNNTWGEILNYNSAGLYEFQQVNSLNSNQLVFDCGLQNNYLATGKTQIIRVPRFNFFNINIGASVTCPAWNGQTGGIVVVEALNNTTINGSINVVGKGFRGGVKENWDVSSSIQVFDYSSSDSTYGAEKGEGIGGNGAIYTTLGGRFCRGAAANGGGGGNGHNSGGGGGSNSGIGFWNGLGNPDNGIGNAYASAWNLEGFSFSNNISSGGGRGGYSYSKYDKDAISLAPGDTAWGGNSRNNVGGMGGRPLYNGNNSQRIFMGGGGGAGDGNNSANTDGASGGGIVMIISYDNISGTGNILANGNNGLVTPLSYLGGDAPGGGGGGGSIVLNATGNINNIYTYANGGQGGNQNITILEAEGPGGGGGGGYIASSNGTFFQQANGGINGTTNSPGLTEFPPNGATKGAMGLTNQSITNFQITALGDTICKGGSTQINSSLLGNIPSGTVILWHNDSTGGVSIHSGNSFTTPILNTTTTYYVSSCPGTYRIPVIVKVNPLPTANAGTDTTICLGQNVNFHATGGSLYHWNTGATTSSISVSPTVNSTYFVTVTDALGCSNKDTVVLNINPLPIADAGHDTSVCSGLTFQLNATGGTSCLWNASTTLSNNTIYNPIAHPAITTKYFVTVFDINQCSSKDSILITVNPLPQAAISGVQHICMGDSTIFQANSGGAYNWSTGDTSLSIKVSPGTNTSYFLTVTDILGCKNYDTTLLTVLSLPIVGISNDDSICKGTSSNLSATGGGTYLWSPTTGLSSSTISNPVATPSNSITYTVTVTGANGCSQTKNTSINLYTEPSINITQNIYNGCPPLHILFSDTNSSGISGWEWNFGDPSSGSNNIMYLQNPSHIYNTSGNYSVILTLSYHGCHKTDTFNNIINIYQKPFASFDALPAVTNILQPTISFNNNSANAVSYLWNFGDALSALNTSTDFSPTHTYSEEATYNIKLITYSQNGCMDSCFRDVIINPEFTFFIPNVFTPNGDGINDYFQGTGKNFSEVQMYIYDQWGELIYESNDYNKPWNGNYKNITGNVIEAVYVYKFVVKDFRGKMHEYIGHVTLL